MNSIRNVFLVALALAASVTTVAAQATLTSTTLSAAIADTQTRTLTLTSATGVVAKTTSIYVDRELMPVIAVSGTTIQVGSRGAAGTKATTHVSGAKVYLGLTYYFSAYDRAGSCTSTNEQVLPVINTTSGGIFQCLSSGQWIKVSVGTMGGGADSQPVRSFCTGTVGSAETEYLNGAACSGATTATARQVMSSAGTLANLYVFTSAGFTAGTNKDVLTVYKNGSSTTLTCTGAASATSCTDITHSVAVVAGDVITFQFVSATSDAAANVSAGVEKY